MHVPGVVAVLLFTAVAVEASAETKVAVLPLKPGHGVAAGVAEVATDALVTALQANGIRVITTKDVESVLGFESEKAKINVEIAKRMGDAVCVDNQSCLAEIGGALGVTLVVSGSISRIGTSSVLSAQLFDQRKAVVLQRFQKSVKTSDDAAFLELAAEAAPALLGVAKPGPTPVQQVARAPAQLPGPPAKGDETRASPTSSPGAESLCERSLSRKLAVIAGLADGNNKQRTEAIVALKRVLQNTQPGELRNDLQFQLSELHLEQTLALVSKRGAVQLLAAARANEEAKLNALEVVRISAGLLKDAPEYRYRDDITLNLSHANQLLGNAADAERSCAQLSSGFVSRLAR